MRRITALFAFVGLTYVACGPGTKSVPQQPQIQTNVNALLFDTEFGSGTFIGTSLPGSMQIFNNGQDDLVISSIERTDDLAAFTFDLPAPLSSTIHGGSSTLLGASFTPSVTGFVDGGFIIHSNAQNVPAYFIQWVGYGVNPPIVRTSVTVIDFGSVTVDSSIQGSVQVFNDGESDLTINGVDLINDRGAFITTGAVSGTVHPDASTILTALFEPSGIITGADGGQMISTNPVVYDGGMIIHTNAVNVPDVTIGLVGVGLPDAG